jgi:hypothetical protein
MLRMATANFTIKPPMLSGVFINFKNPIGSICSTKTRVRFLQCLAAALLDVDSNVQHSDHGRSFQKLFSLILFVDWNVERFLDGEVETASGLRNTTTACNGIYRQLIIVRGLLQLMEEIACTAASGCLPHNNS